MFRLALVAAVGALASTPAYAMECWQVTGWSTSVPRGLTMPAGAFERAVVVPVDCDVTPPGYQWLHVTEEYSSSDPAPDDLHVLASIEDTTRVLNYELLRGLKWQTRYGGVLPVMWRRYFAPALPFELQAPAPATPAVGAVVALRQANSGKCAMNGSGVDYQSPHIWLDYLGCGGASLTLDAGYRYEIVDAGTNAAGEPMIWLESTLSASCGYVEDWYGTEMVLHEYCSEALSGFDMRLVPVSGGGYRIRSEDTGLCYGGPIDPGGYNHWLMPASCTSSDSVYDVITMIRAPSGGGGGGTVPGEEM